MAIANIKGGKVVKSDKLHLGCGQVYLDGYVNIDYPLDEHTVQTNSVADKYADLTRLRYKEESVQEVRLHHVFEHFVRADALALVASWSSWLKKEGVLRIEVPDFDRTAKVVLSRFSSKQQKRSALRHIFGSNEAHWAVHYEGWTEDTLKDVLSEMGFTVIAVRRTAWLSTRNIEVTARKDKKLSKTQAKKAAQKYLSGFLVDESKSEKHTLSTWVKDFTVQLDKTWAKSKTSR